MEAFAPSSTGAPDLPVTERLSLRRFTPDDLDRLDSLYSDPDVSRHVGGVLTREQTAELLRVRIIEYYQHNPGLGIWATHERESGRWIGFHLLNHIQGESHLQVGYVLAREAWGRGYATEMAAALLRYGFESLRLPRICAICNLENGASQRVLLKIGLQRKGERSFAHPAYAASGPLAWFERDADEWLAAQA